MKFKVDQRVKFKVDGELMEGTITYVDKYFLEVDGDDGQKHMLEVDGEYIEPNTESMAQWTAKLQHDVTARVNGYADYHKFDREEAQYIKTDLTEGSLIWYYKRPDGKEFKVIYFFKTQDFTTID